jgi:hypothetical protein
MKIRFVKNVLVEVYKSRLDEVWDKQYRRWDEIEVDSISEGKFADVRTTEGDAIYGIPEIHLK